MKKVTNITLGSVVFAIEEEAYTMLEIYLDEIKTRLYGSDDQDEIMVDIESALAEKLLAVGRNEKLAVTVTDIERVQGELGAPTAFGETEEGSTGAPKHTQTESRRQLFRDTDDAVIAGVASGLARYFDLDPVIVRIAFLVGVFLNGLGPVAYIVLWIAVPRAETATEKYAMRGERVTLRDISERIKKNITDSDVADTEYVRSAWQRVRPVCARTFELLGVAARGLLSVFRIAGGGVSLVAGVFGLVALTSLYSISWLADGGRLPQTLQSIREVILQEPLGFVFLGALFVLLFIPLLLLVVLGVSLLRWRTALGVSAAVLLAVFWIVALTTTITTGAIVGERFVLTSSSQQLSSA